MPGALPAAAVSERFVRDQRDFMAAFGLVLVYILGSHFIDREGTVGELSWDLGFFLLVALAAIYFRRVLRPALEWRTFKLKTLLRYLGMQVLFTAVVIWSMNALDHALHLRDPGLMQPYRDGPYPLAAALLSVAVAPAISEELAFRGILFGQLRLLTGATNCVLVTGFLFALVHFRFLGIIWLVPAGLFFGWMRHREGVIWYGVICHFLHNATVVIGDAQGWW